MSKLSVKIVLPSNAEVVSLISRLDAYLSSLYPIESNHLASREQLSLNNCKMIGAFDGDVLVGVGACLLLNSYAEIKRVFVVQEYRNKGVATLLMEQIEKIIRLADLPLARLETGVQQLEAIKFYNKIGYKIRSPFGSYKPDPLSIFMEKIMI